MDRKEFLRFWWSETPEQAEYLLDTLGNDSRFWKLMGQFLHDWQMSGKEFGFELQKLCETVEEEIKEANRKYQGSIPFGGDGPEAA